MQPKLSRVALAISGAFSISSVAFGQTADLDTIVITAPRMEEPLKVVTDPKRPRQPVPAHDGADYLKSIPGFSVIRKGGTDGDPVLRGMAGSRLNVLLDGEQILGGCGMRMDPPTAYVFPEAYDRITVIKGPQSVMNGPGSSAGSVLFERDIKRFEQPGWKVNGSLMGGSFGRHDEVLEARAGNPLFYVQGSGTRSHSGDYEDGGGQKVFSRYTRWSANGALGWTPDKDTRVELSAAASDGEAAYADRTMDGVEFNRRNLGFKFQKANLSPLVDKLETQIYYNYVDHVMDNYSLRDKPASAMFMVNNPDRETVGGRAVIGLRFSETTRLQAGVDYQTNKHTLRSAMASAAAGAPNVGTLARVEDASFRNFGLFGELTHWIGDRDRVVAGLRADDWRAQDKRAARLTARDELSRAYAIANPTSGKRRDDLLSSGFARYEHNLESSPTTLFAGLGHSERFPDYWELISFTKESLTTNSAFDTRPEKTTQLDIGAIYKGAPWSASVSGFYGKVDDYIMIQSGVVKTSPVRRISVTRNIDATTWGGEASLAYALRPSWTVNGTLAYVRGDNETDGRPLAQLPPLEGRLGLTYDNGTWSVGSLLRLVAAQDRFDAGKGNIVGQDIGRTPGFGVLSLNGSYKPAKGALIAIGIDNVFDRKYAEHISRTGSPMGGVAGYVQTTRVNEPGRAVWIKAQLALD
ncbi:MAG: TonB-dependent copper receptor [Rhodocyclaceae bacterium]